MMMIDVPELCLANLYAEDYGQYKSLPYRSVDSKQTDILL